jgi:hypothetical protein
VVSVAYALPRVRTTADTVAGSDALDARVWTLDGPDAAREVRRQVDSDRVRRAVGSV